MICTKGRISWPVFSAILFSTVAILLTDFAWRFIHVSIVWIAAAGAAFLLAGNAAILVIGAKSGKRAAD